MSLKPGQRSCFTQNLGPAPVQTFKGLPRQSMLRVLMLKWECQLDRSPIGSPFAQDATHFINMRKIARCDKQVISALLKSQIIYKAESMAFAKWSYFMLAVGIKGDKMCLKLTVRL